MGCGTKRPRWGRSDPPRAGPEATRSGRARLGRPAPWTGSAELDEVRRLALRARRRGRDPPGSASAEAAVSVRRGRRSRATGRPRRTRPSTLGPFGFDRLGHATRRLRGHGSSSPGPSPEGSSRLATRGPFVSGLRAIRPRRAAADRARVGPGPLRVAAFPAVSARRERRSDAPGPAPAGSTPVRGATRRCAISERARTAAVPVLEPASSPGRRTRAETWPPHSMRRPPGLRRPTPAEP